MSLEYLQPKYQGILLFTLSHYPEKVIHVIKSNEFTIPLYNILIKNHEHSLSFYSLWVNQMIEEAKHNQDSYQLIKKILYIESQSRNELFI